LGFPLNQAASIGVIGAIDGPTSIFVASKLAPELLAPIAVAAYSYMSLIPIIQPPLMRALTTKKERLIKMEYAPKPISKRTLIFFPVVITLVVGIARPRSDAADLHAHAWEFTQGFRCGGSSEQCRAE
jgi:carboxybiotin decarboxylase